LKGRCWTSCSCSLCRARNRWSRIPRRRRKKVVVVCYDIYWWICI